MRSSDLQRKVLVFKQVTWKQHVDKLWRRNVRMRSSDLQRRDPESKYCAKPQAGEPHYESDNFPHDQTSIAHQSIFACMIKESS